MKMPEASEIIETTRDHWSTCRKDYAEGCWTCRLHFVAMEQLRETDGDDGLYIGELFDRIKGVRSRIEIGRGL